MQGQDNRGQAAPVNSLYSKTESAQLENKRSAAKVGMAISLGTAVTSGLMSGRRAKAWHLCSGVALIGFSVWHYSLYPTPPRRQGR